MYMSPQSCPTRVDIGWYRWYHYLLESGSELIFKQLFNSGVIHFSQFIAGMTFLFVSDSVSFVSLEDYVVVVSSYHPAPMFLTF